MKKNFEFIMGGEKLILSRQDSEKVFVETMLKQINNKSKNFNKGSLFKPPSNENRHSENNLFSKSFFQKKVDIEIPNFSRLKLETINRIDFKGREESLEYYNKNNNIKKKKDFLIFKNQENEKKENEKNKKLYLEKLYNDNKNHFFLTLYKGDLPKMKYLQNLLYLLKFFFKNKKINQNLTLDYGEKKILNSILKRKYKTKIDLNTSMISIIDKIEQIKLDTISKRPEQNYKLIFMLTLKYMKEELKGEIDRNMRKKDFEKYFYNYYFKVISDQNGIPLEHFYHPKNSKAQKLIKEKNIPKTINLYYIENISKSKKFLEIFFSYLKNDLIEDYEKLIDYKLDTLFHRWSISIYEHENKKIALNKICKYMEENNKCKLPWDINEIQIAIDCTKKLFN